MSWSTLSAVNLDARVKWGGDDESAVLASMGDSKWVALWAHSDLPEYTAGGVANDQSYTLSFAISKRECPVAPSSCMTTTEPARSKFKLTSDLDLRGKLTWTWKGQETTLADIGDPETDHRYHICLYEEEAGTTRLLLEKDAPAGEVCGKRPCWQSKGEKGFKYKDSKQSWGPIGKVLMRPGPSGKAKLKVKAKGPFLGPPPMPLAQASPLPPSANDRVIVQWHNSTTGKCWGAEFSAAKKNSVETFIARSD
jgi:hypothetical protein